VLGDVCIFYYMEDATFRQENIDFFCFFMWMKNPDLLPRSKVVSFFTQSPGRSSSSDGPPPMATALASSMIGGEVDLLIHLDHYYDWSPHLEGSSISDVSGLPASSSEASSSAPSLQELHLVPRCGGWSSVGAPFSPAHDRSMSLTTKPRPP
jgi:hypothetical protein